MKRKRISRTICFTLICLIVFTSVAIFFCGCGSSDSTHTEASNLVEDTINEQIENETNSTETDTDQTAQGETTMSSDDSIDTSNADIDLTKMSSDLVYASVYNIMVSPDSYVGHTIKMNGEASIYTDSSTGTSYAAIIISDATACCSQGIEFQLSGDYVCPDGYPSEGKNVTIFGTLETYEENGYTYIHAANASIVD